MDYLLFYDKLEAAFEMNRDTERAMKMKAYMKHRFDYYGIASPLRKKITGELIKEHGMPNRDSLQALSTKMWQAECREMQYVMMDLSNRYLKKLDSGFIPFYEKLIGQKSWWDSIDWLSPKAIGCLFKRFPQYRQAYIDRWIISPNKWYVRSAILFQLHYKQNTDFALLQKLILQTLGSKEFFINKASGWALRQYSKTDPIAVIKFIADHPELNNLTRREGLKWLKGRKDQ